MTNTVLLLIDIQNDCFPGGRLPLARAEVPAAQVQAAFLAALDGSFARVASVAELVR
jgi:hypothetical protein